MTIRQMATISVLALLLPVTACGRAAGAVARGAERGAARSLERSFARLLRRDALRDTKLPVKTLTRSRTVFRYTSRQQAAKEARAGVLAGSHTTAGGGAGRPVSAATALRRFGLGRTPEVRETIKLSAGQPVRSGRVIGGARGVGELTSTKTIPPSSIKRVIRIP